MFRELRRKKRAIDNEAAAALLRSERRGVLAVNGDDGYPYAVPIDFLYDEEKNKIYFHGAKAGYKIEALRACDKVCFTVYGHETVRKEQWAPYVQSVVIFGRCHLLDNIPWVMDTAKRFAMKYFPDESIADKEIASFADAMQMFEIEIENMCGKEIQEK